MTDTENSDTERRQCPNCREEPTDAASQDAMAWKVEPDEILWICGNKNCRVREYWGAPPRSEDTDTEQS
jgi:hypothetical protein